MNEKISLPALVSALSLRSGDSKKQSEEFIKEFFAIIADTLADGEQMKIKNFGVFKTVTVGARKSVNVSTGEDVVIPAHPKVVFTPAKELAALVNEPFEMFETVELADGVDDADDIEDSGVVETVVETLGADNPDLGNSEPENSAPDNSDPDNSVSDNSASDNSGSGNSASYSSDDGNPGDVDNMAEDQESAQDFETGEIADVEDVTVAEVEEVADDYSIYNTDESAFNDNEENASETETILPDDSVVADDHLAEEEKEGSGNPESKDRRSRRKALVWVAAAVGFILVALGAFWLGMWYQGNVIESEVRSQVSAYMKQNTVRTDTLKTVEAESSVVNNKDSLAAVASDNETASSAKMDDPQSMEKSKSTSKEELAPTAPSDQKKYDTISKTRFLGTMAKEYYGDYNFWPYIYKENESRLGHPDRIRPGTRVAIPSLKKYGIDPKNPADLKKAKRLGTEIYSRYK